jgi:hypothetical protein
VFTSALFSALWVVISKSVEIGEIQRATKIEFTRLKRDSDVKTRAKQQKVQLEKPAQVQSAPQIAIDMGVGDRGGPASTFAADVGASGARLARLRRGRRAAAHGRSGGPRRRPPVRIEPISCPRRAARHRRLRSCSSRLPGGTTRTDHHRRRARRRFRLCRRAAVSRWKYNPKWKAEPPSGAAVFA